MLLWMVKMIEIYKILTPKWPMLHSFTQCQYLSYKMMFVFQLSYANLTRQRIAQIYAWSYGPCRHHCCFVSIIWSYNFRIILHMTYICTPPGFRRNCRYSRPLYRRPTKLECICHWRIEIVSKDRLVYLRIKKSSLRKFQQMVIKS